MKKGFRLVALILLLSVFLAGFTLGIQGKKGASSQGAEIYEYLRTLSDVIDIVKRNYVEEVKDRELVYSAIKGMLESLDAHSTFLSPEMYKDMQQETKGEFGGIGIEITVRDGFPTVVAPIEDTPAAKAGLRAGDQIVRIDAKPTKNMGLAEVVRMIRGPRGTSVTLTIMRGGLEAPFDVTIMREIIQVKSVKTKIMENEFGYVRITQFQEKTAKDLRKAIEELREKKVKGIVLDLRTNPGGLLEQAVEVADLFLSEGTIVTISGRKKENVARFSARRNGEYEGPLVVLINEGSASASEIVAGALQDHRRAVIVGSKSFGKGSVQTIFPLDDGSAVKLTTARYHTPSGRSIQGEGIQPDITVEANLVRKKDAVRPLREKDLEREPKEKREQKEPAEEEDFQLNMALQILKGWEALRGKGSNP
jgi:carboxyl-terminal processing protease